MKHTFTSLHMVAAAVVTFSLTFGAGYSTSQAFLTSNTGGLSFGASLVRTHTGTSLLSVRPVKRAKKVVRKLLNRRAIVRPVNRRLSGSVVPFVRPAATTQPISAACGDKLVIPALGEECDDGNVASGDGCSATCMFEAGFSCGGQPTVCSSRCGDGTLTPVEKCDDGNFENGDGCSSVCKIESRYVCTGTPSVCELTPYCGDGIKALAEACDDGNGLPGDGCYQCKTE